MQPAVVSRPGLRRILALIGLAFIPAPCLAQSVTPFFEDATSEAGISSFHTYAPGVRTNAMEAVGGVAAGDFDRDGFVDLYLINGDLSPNALMRNRGDGTFENVSSKAGVAVSGERGSGATFSDLDGDGWVDLFLGGVADTKPRVFRNLGDGTFLEITAETGIQIEGDTISAAFGDYDRDGDLDLFTTNWTGPGVVQPLAHLWHNLGNGTFTPIPDQAIGLDVYHDPDSKGRPGDFTLTPNFADIDSDGWPDLLVAGDFGTSHVFLNNRDRTFRKVTDDSVITDENGMGASVGDYDNDGDLDWFVSSIFDDRPNVAWGPTGNRLYRNDGSGTFEDVTEEAGVREGFWGWASCFSDFDNDGHLDLFHVNGFVPLRGREEPNPVGSIFWNDPSRLYMSNGDGTFSERSEEMGLIDTRQGRGLVCFDYDRDGDVDVLVANNSGPHSLYRNQGGNANNFLAVKLIGLAPNTDAIGSRVYLTTASGIQMRETRCGSNYLSQQPAEMHFGLGGQEGPVEVRVVWASGRVDVLSDVAANSFLTIRDVPRRRATPSRSGWQTRGR